MMGTPRVREMTENPKRCGAKTRSGTPCQSWGLANGRCRMHGGTSPGRPIIHGRYSLIHRAALAAKVATFLADPRPGDLTDELALLRALLQDYLERFPDGVPLPIKDIERVLDMVDAVARLVERISRIVNQTALTQAEVQLLQVRIVDLLVKYVDDPSRRLAFLDELGATFDRGPGGARTALTADTGR